MFYASLGIIRALSLNLSIWQGTLSNVLQVSHNEYNYCTFAMTLFIYLFFLTTPKPYAEIDMSKGSN